MLSVWMRRCLALFCVLACMAVATHAFGYLYQAVNLRNPFHLSFAEAGWSAPAHFFAAGLALLLLPLPLSAPLRRRWPRLHRVGGGLYVVAVAIAAVAGFLLAPRAQGGWPSGLSFALLAALWLFTTGRALLHARRGQIAAHRCWMLRSAALTFAAVTLRLYLGLGLAVFGWDFSRAYLVAAWACWTLNLLGVELWLRWRSATSVAEPALDSRSVSCSVGVCRRR